MSFSILGVPIRVGGWLFVWLAFLGGALQVQSVHDFIPVALFIVAGFLSILAHEMGHALSFRKYTGQTPSVTLDFFGGATYMTRGMTKMQDAIVSFAGPLTGLVFGLLVAWLIFASGGNASFATDAVWAFATSIVGYDAPLLEMTFHPDDTTYYKLILGRYFVMVAVLWTILNLLPILPMDGGRILAAFVKSPRTVHTVGMVVAGVCSVLALSFGIYVLAVFMGMFAYYNYRWWQAARF